MKYQSLGKSFCLTERKIQPEVGEPGWSNFLKPVNQLMPEHKLPCECEMCKQYQYKKYKQALNTQTIVYNNKLKNRLQKKDSEKLLQLIANYHWLVRHLVIPTHKIATHNLSIFVSESLFFRDGQAIEVYLSKDLEDPTIRKIPKEKLTNTFIQKIMADRRRRYKEYIRMKTGRKKVEPKKKLFFGQKQVKKQIKDAVLIRYIDGVQQLLTQNQFLVLLQKRKQDPIWKQVLCMRNFINIQNQQQGSNTSYHVIKYKKGNIRYEQLFQRSKTLTKVYGQYINPGDKDYIAQADEIKFQNQLKKMDVKAYVEYLVYQIANYIEYFYDEQIVNITIGIFIDQLGHPFINQVYRLQTRSLVKFEWTNDLYRKIMDEQQNRILGLNKNQDNPSSEGNAKLIVETMHQAYQKMRDYFGLNPQDEDNCEQVANNNFFKKLHPEFEHNISDVLKDPNLTIADFKLKFMGYKQKKKSIVKQFTSPLIKTLHLTTPRLVRADPHLYISPNKNRTLSTFDNSKKTRFSILSPIKKDFNSKLYQTLPVRDLDIQI